MEQTDGKQTDRQTDSFIDPAPHQCFFWRYEPVRRTGKSDDWLTFFWWHNKVHCSEIPIVLSNLLYHYFFIELWYILILWLTKMPNGGMPVFTLIATGWRYRKIFFYKKALLRILCEQCLQMTIDLTTWHAVHFDHVQVKVKVIGQCSRYTTKMILVYGCTRPKVVGATSSEVFWFLY